MTPVGAPALHVVVLAAGKGTRMKSSLAKVLHRLAGRTLIDHVLRAVSPLRAASTVLVVGHGAEEVKAALSEYPGLEFVTQSPQLGTGHALLQTEPILRTRPGTVLLVYADVPLLQPGTLSRLLEAHRAAGAAATVLTVNLADPQGYGRIVRDGDGRLARIVEQKDASAAERALTEINSGIYALELGPLFDRLHRLATDNAQGEYYLTDLFAAYRQAGLRLETVTLDDAHELRGVNTRVELAELGRVLRARKNRDVMLDGATLEDPDSTAIDADVTIGPDTIIAPGVLLEGRTTVGRNCRIGRGSRLTDSVIGDDVTIRDYSVLSDVTVGAGARIGPFAHLRPGSRVGKQAQIGNFVELKKTTLGAGSKASHLTYLGDATIGADVNVGAGTITCNYDGETKQPTIIEDGAFIGSDSQLIAPVRIGRNGYVAAGSSITSDVPDDALAIGRGRQENKPGWAAKKRNSKLKT